MIWVDFTILALLAMAVVFGIVRGGIKSVFALAFWILALWVCLNFTEEFSPFLAARFDNVTPRLVASFASLLVITLSLGTSIGWLLGEWVKPAEMGFFARFGGMVFGFLQGMIWVLLLVMMAGLTALPKDPWWQESRFLPPFQQVATVLRDHISSGITKNINYQ